MGGRAVNETGCQSWTCEKKYVNNLTVNFEAMCGLHGFGVEMELEMFRELPILVLSSFAITFSIGLGTERYRLSDRFSPAE